MQGNLPVSFGKGAMEKDRKAPRRCPTSFGGSQTEKEQPCHLAGWLPYSRMMREKYELKAHYC